MPRAGYFIFSVVSVQVKGIFTTSQDTLSAPYDMM